MSSNLTLDQVAASQAQKEVAINDIFGQVDAAVTELLSVNLAAGNATITAAQARRAMLLRTTGNAVARDLTLPQIKRELTIQNGGSATLSIKRGATTITLGAGLVTKVYTDGTTDGMVASGGGSGGTYTASTGLSLVGNDFQVSDAELLALMALASAANKVPYFTGLGTAALADFSAFGRSLVDDADATAARATLGLVIGTNVQAWDADLDTWATKTAPGGTVVGTTDPQTLTNKTFAAGSNMLTGIATSMFAANVVDTDAALAANSNTRLASQAAVKSYVDNSVAAAIVGLAWKSSVKAASTGNLTLSGTQTVDGVALAAADRVLVKNQTTGSQNGIYVVAAGAWSRSTDADTAAEIEGAAVMVAQGTTQADTQWNMTADGVTLGSTTITWVQFGAANSYSPGTGLGLTGNTFNITDPELLALLGLTSAANKVPYFTGSGTAALADLSAYGRTLIDDADATAARSTLGLVIGTDVQAYDADLAAIAALTSAADQAPYATGAGTWSMMTVTAVARTVLDDTTTAAMLATLGALPAAGGTITGDLFQTSGRYVMGAASAFSTRSATNGVTPNFQVLSTGAAASMMVGRFSNDAFQWRFFGVKSRGTTIGSHGACSAGDVAGEFSFGWSNGSFICEGARMIFSAEEAPGTTYTPARIGFHTSAPGGAIPVERVAITAAGDLQMGGTNTVISSARHVQLRSYTVGTLPSAATAAQLVYVSDGTSFKRLAVSDGTNWRWPDGAVVS